MQVPDLAAFLPNVTMPQKTTKKVTVLDITTKTVQVPSLTTKTVQVPTLGMPNITYPTLTKKKVGCSALGQAGRTWLALAARQAGRPLRRAARRSHA